MNMDRIIDQAEEENESDKSNCFKRFVCGLDYIFCYQWRKKMLYIFFCVIILLISVNFALTIWVFTVLQISPNHIGQIKFLKAGFEFSGNVLIMDMLKASKIYTEPNQDILIETRHLFVMQTTRNDSSLENSLKLGYNHLELVSNEVSFRNDENYTIFEINSNEVYLNTTELEIHNANGGTVLNESIAFSSLVTPYGFGLVFESPTKSIEMRTDEDVLISAKSGDFQNVCLKDMKLDAEKSIYLLAPDILIPDMQISIKEEETRNVFSVTDYNFFVRTYQMCICENGKVFLTLPQNSCILLDSSKTCD